MQIHVATMKGLRTIEITPETSEPYTEQQSSADDRAEEELRASDPPAHIIISQHRVRTYAEILEELGEL